LLFGSPNLVANENYNFKLRQPVGRKADDPPQSDFGGWRSFFWKWYAAANNSAAMTPKP
jgi:hypothetical protein